MKPLLHIQHLSLHIGEHAILKNINLTVDKGETVAIVGESGSGKSMTALSVMGLLPEKAVISEGNINFTGQDLLTLSQRGLSAIRGKRIAMVFQDPMSSLNPVLTAGEQVLETLLQHQQLSRSAAKKQVLSLFGQVQLADAERIYRSYPHQLSGGQKQRIMIAMALSCQPDLLIADEPTTALDATVQKKLLVLLKQLQQHYGFSILFISHDLGVVKAIADRAIVMQKGSVVEVGSTQQIFQHPKHTYTRHLLGSQPSAQLAERGDLDFDKKILLKLTDWSVTYTDSGFWKKSKNVVKAVQNVNLTLHKGEIFGLVGESGSGKSSLARSMMGLEPSATGTFWYDGVDMKRLDDYPTSLRRKIQMIFQDPMSSLNPAQPIGLAIAEPILVHRLQKSKKDSYQKAEELLETVGLKKEHFWRFPSRFSGGERQRITIARALAMQPELLICDEAVSSLDVSIQQQILDLLRHLQQQMGLTYLFITHDLSVVRNFCDRVMVMKDGQVVEYGVVQQVFEQPEQAYTKELLEAILV